MGADARYRLAGASTHDQLVGTFKSCAASIASGAAFTRAPLYAEHLAR